MRISPASWLGLMGTAIIIGGTVSVSVAAGPKHVPLFRSAPPVRCDGAIQHPITVKATALDPLRRGEIVRVRVTTTSRNGLDRGEVRLTSAGGAELVSAARVPLKRLAAGRESVTEFAVRLPAEGQRFLLQFRVSGEGQSGIEARGATLNLLPDGIADAGRVVTTSSGERIVEYRARRVGQ